MIGGEKPKDGQKEIKSNKGELLEFQRSSEFFKLSIVTYRAMWGIYKTHGDIEEADCVFGFSFGYRDEGGEVLPGESNELLAEYYVNHLPHLPVFTQFELGDAIAGKMGSRDQIIEAIQTGQVTGEYVGTDVLVDQFKQLAAECGFEKPVMLAHAYHMPLVDYHLQEKRDVNTIAPPNLREFSEFDPNSTQEWTRSPNQWRKGVLNSAFSTAVSRLGLK